MECQKCKKVLSRKGSHFMCQGPCQGTFHRSCVKGLAADMKAGINRIYCNNCEEEGTDEDELEPEEEVKDLQKILKDIQLKVGAIPGLKKHLDMIKQSISVLSEKYDTILNEYEQAKEKITKLEKTTINVTNKCIYLEKCNLALEQKLNDFEQTSRRNNLEITGVECIPGENVKDIVIRIGTEIGIATQDIEWVRRSRPAKREGRPPAIIVGFKASGVESRNKWLERRRQLLEKSITSNSIVAGGTKDSKIYVNEDLVPSTRTLLWNAKQQLRGIYKYIWVSDGRILVKRAEGDKTLWIKHVDDLSALQKQNK